MSSVEETIEVAVPVSTAYNQWTQFKSFPRFMTVVKRVEQIRPNLTRWVVGFGPLRHEFDAEIVDQRPDSLVTWRSLGARAGHRGEVSFRATGPGRTEVAVRIDFRSPGTPGLRTRVAGVARRTVRAELGHFKEFIEGVGREGGAWRGAIRDGHVRPVDPEPARCRVPHWPVG